MRTLIHRRVSLSYRGGGTTLDAFRWKSAFANEVAS
jgi:hypothetical protein